jgi:hypothetical protein
MPKTIVRPLLEKVGASNSSYYWSYSCISTTICIDSLSYFFLYENAVKKSQPSC